MPRTLENVGWQRKDTSRNAAHDINRRVRTIRVQIMSLLNASRFPLTAEEIAAILELPYENVQPRLSEMRNSLVIEDSGHRKTSRFNKPIIAWAPARKARP